MILICTKDRPWGVHETVRSDENCPRCGWTAPGPIGDAAEEALALAEGRGWPGDDGDGDGEALAA